MDGNSLQNSPTNNPSDQSHKSDQGSDASHADIGIVCALPIELNTFLNRCERVRKYVGDQFVFRGGRYSGARIAVVESGMGFARARAATEQLLEAHTPGWVLSSGFCGGLLESTKSGDIVVATSICDTHGQQLKVDVSMASQPGLHVGRIVVTDEMVRTVEEKQRLAAESGAVAVDLESLAVAQVCAERSVKFMSVRVVSDDLSEDLPPEVLSIIGDTGTMRLGAALGAVWKRPGSVKDLWRLRERAWAAAERLADFLDGVINQLKPAE